MIAVEMLNITKVYGDVNANDNISIKINKGDIHAIVGENGAGKSTLMKVLYGMIKQDAGSIFINGIEVNFNSPHDAIDKGIGMIHQHFMLIDNMTVLDNIVLGNEKVKYSFILNENNALATVKELIKNYNLAVDTNSKIEDIQIGQQQKVEILKLLFRNADILILDEPTAVLTPQETEDLFRTLRELKNDGKTCIIITHKLNEVLSISDAITVLRHGKVAGYKNTKDTNAKELSELIVGEEIIRSENLHDDINGDTKLKLENVFVYDKDKIEKLKSIDLELVSGQILGLAGVEGSGQEQIVNCITGLIKPDKGKIIYKNKNTFVSYIPDDRHKYGMIEDFTLYENVLLGRHNEEQFNNGIFLNFRKLIEVTENIIKNYDVRPGNSDAKAQSLSGGNQQKLVVGREMDKNSEIIIVNQPTRGLDIKASEFVHSSILQARKDKKAILVISSDLQELLKLSDRIAVIYNGEIRAVLNSTETNEKELGEYMLGIK